MVTTLAQLPAAVDINVVAGNPRNITVTVTGVTVTSPVVTMLTAAGEPFTTNPGIPSVNVAGDEIQIQWTVADTAALNTTRRDKTYFWSLQATLDGDGPYELLARHMTVKPVGSAGASTSSSTTLAFTIGESAVALTVSPGIAGSGNIDGGTPSSVYGGTIGIDGGTP